VQIHLQAKSLPRAFDISWLCFTDVFIRPLPREAGGGDGLKRNLAKPWWVDWSPCPPPFMLRSDDGEHELGGAWRSGGWRMGAGVVGMWLAGGDGEGEQSWLAVAYGRAGAAIGKERKITGQYCGYETWEWGLGFGSWARPCGPLLVTWVLASWAQLFQIIWNIVIWNNSDENMIIWNLVRIRPKSFSIPIPTNPELFPIQFR
jgi:hypothetical protein